MGAKVLRGSGGSAKLRARPTMKAIGVAAREDFAAAEPYEGVADLLLIDAKPPRMRRCRAATAVPSTGAWRGSFDPRRPWLLSGGLDPSTVEAAIAPSGASGVDVSSGVESAPGVKDPARIRAFVAAARRAFARSAVGVA